MPTIVIGVAINSHRTIPMMGFGVLNDNPTTPLLCSKDKERNAYNAHRQCRISHYQNRPQRTRHSPSIMTD
jgi:hypothetical protein